MISQYAKKIADRTTNQSAGIFNQSMLKILAAELANRMNLRLGALCLYKSKHTIGHFTFVF